MEMDQVTERLVEEVRKYSHLYDSSSAEYKDCQMAANSWREISSNVGLDVADCMKRWKNTRDKYVRLRKKLATKSGDPGGKKVPAFYFFLSWLAPHVKHRLTESNFDDKDGSDSSSNSTGSAVVMPSVNDDEQLQSCSPHRQPSPLSFQPSLPSPQPSPMTAQPSPMTPQPSPMTPSPRMAQKRKRTEQDDWIQMQVARLEAQLEERRVELQQRLSQENDESDRFGNTVADMLRRVPEEHRAHAMFDVSKVLFEWQQKK
ncbi:transcription factor Adf-1-like [Pimephales promelas]|uniref:transcription factor Adf-1-like n=1 Tax=Pimephales promelas TaxID=90988 RepID=UPI001955C8B7|nr:transcription factor Adf-1-like [Pimephales promelas]